MICALKRHLRLASLAFVAFVVACGGPAMAVPLGSAESGVPGGDCRTDNGRLGAKRTAVQSPAEL